MPLIRCASCRYSFEHVEGEPPKTCPQCGGNLLTAAAPKSAAPLDDKKTLKLKTIPKPED